MTTATPWRGFLLRRVAVSSVWLKLFMCKHQSSREPPEIFDLVVGEVLIAVFVVEQNCAYQEIDDKDQYSYHVFLKDDTGIRIYLRVIDKGVSFEEV